MSKGLKLFRYTEVHGNIAYFDPTEIANIREFVYGLDNDSSPFVVHVTLKSGFNLHIIGHGTVDGFRDELRHFMEKGE